MCHVFWGIVVQQGWRGLLLKLYAWKVGDRGFEPRSDIQVSKKENVSSTLIREESIMWESFRDRAVSCSASDRQRSNFESVSGEQCHLIHLTILGRLSWPNLAYVCTKMALNPAHFISFARRRLWDCLRYTPINTLIHTHAWDPHCDPELFRDPGLHRPERLIHDNGHMLSARWQVLKGCQREY